MENPVELFSHPIEKCSRETVLKLEQELLKLPQFDHKLTHHFSDGIYARELFIPRGTVLTGKIHRFAHLNIIPTGEILVMTEHGVKHIEGPCTLQSYPGIKRAGFALKDTIWITIHHNPDNERDLDALEERFTAPSFEEIDVTSVKEDLICLGS